MSVGYQSAAAGSTESCGSGASDVVTPFSITVSEPRYASHAMTSNQVDAIVPRTSYVSVGRCVCYTSLVTQPLVKMQPGNDQAWAARRGVALPNDQAWAARCGVALPKHIGLGPTLSVGHCGYGAAGSGQWALWIRGSGAVGSGAVGSG